MEFGPGSPDTRRSGSGGGSRDSHRTRSEGGSREPTKMEVGPPASSWIPACVILAWGLMRLMGSTCIALGISRVWQEGVTCHPVAVHVTPAELEVGDMSIKCHRTRRGPSSAILDPSGRNLVSGFMRLMATTCIGLAGSPVWRGRVTCPTRAVHVTTAEMEV